MLAARDERRNDRQDGATARRESRDEVRGDRQATRDERLQERSVHRDEQEQARGEPREDRAARSREKLNERPTASGGRTKPAAAGSASAKPSATKVERGKRDVELPGAGTQAGVTEKVKQRSGGAQQAQATGRQAAPKLASAEQIARLETPASPKNATARGSPPAPAIPDRFAPKPIAVRAVALRRPTGGRGRRPRSPAAEENGRLLNITPKAVPGAASPRTETAALSRAETGTVDGPAEVGAEQGGEADERERPSPR